MSPRILPTALVQRAAPTERPLPVWMLYPLFFVAVYLSHYTLLRLPYFWDEAGYYIPAALDVFRTGSLIPHSTTTNAHPPLPSVLLAGWWHLAGYVISNTRVFVCMVSSAALLGVFRLGRSVAGNAVAVTVTLLTAMYPVWFAQSTLAHADIFAAAFTLWALSFCLSEDRSSPSPRIRSEVAIAVLFGLAALSKETAVVTPIALALWEAVLLITRDQGATRAPSLRRLLALLAPVVPLSLWYWYHYRQTGFIFGNPEFLRYNATANLSATRIAVSLWHRLVHLFLHMNMYVATVCTLAALLIPRRTRGTWPRPELALYKSIAIVIVGNALAFSVLGGALLTRYLLPVYPLILLVYVVTWRARMRQWWLLAGLSAAGFVAGLFLNPPYSIAPEDNLTYRDMIVLHQEAIRQIDVRFPAANVLTAWPATTELEHPELGYTRLPVKTVALENFTLEQVTKAANDPGAYDTALVFSTKWTPPQRTLNLGKVSESTDTRLFDLHHDLSAREVAVLLHGDIVWQGERNGEWAAVLRFPRSLDARWVTVPNARATTE